VDIAHARLLDPILCRLIGEAKPSRDTAVIVHLIHSLILISQFGGTVVSELKQLYPQDSPYQIISAQPASNYAELLSDTLVT
jgi:hypothetical protein